MDDFQETKARVDERERVPLWRKADTASSCSIGSTPLRNAGRSEVELKGDRTRNKAILRNIVEVLALPAARFETERYSRSAWIGTTAEQECSSSVRN